MALRRLSAQCEELWAKTEGGEKEEFLVLQGDVDILRHKLLSRLREAGCLF